MSRRLSFSPSGIAIVSGVCHSRPLGKAKPALAALVGCALAFGGGLQAQEIPAGSVAESIAEEVRGLFGKCQKAVVRIEGSDAHGRFSGTGFFIDPNGTLYTSFTVGAESRDITVTCGNVRHPARRLVADPRSGIAVLKVDAETPFLIPGKSRDLTVSSPVLAIGYPMDLPLTPSFGTIAGLDLKFLGRYFATTHLRANVAVQRGEGGAPLLNMRGEVVGVVIASLDQGSALFASPIEAAEKVRKDFMRFGQVRPGWIGIEVGAIETPVHGSVAQVKDLLPDSPGKKAGMETGDVLLQVADRRITSPEDVLDASFFLTAEERVTVKVSRGEVVHQFNVEPSDHPDVLHPIRLPASSSLPVLGGNPEGSLLDR